MKKFLCLAVCGVLLGVAPAHAVPAPTAATPATATPQQNRMKTCAAQYHAEKIAKAQYRAFMSKCLKNPSAPVATPAAKPAQ